MEGLRTKTSQALRMTAFVEGLETSPAQLCLVPELFDTAHLTTDLPTCIHARRF
jgi:hypothetical protein